jgi:hypothetical protein
MNPSDFASAASIDLAEQADLYWAALEATSGVPWIRGVVWWCWPAREVGGAQDGDFTPRGKPAADVLRRAWSVDAAP